MPNAGRLGNWGRSANGASNSIPSPSTTGAPQRTYPSAWAFSASLLTPVLTATRESRRLLSSPFCREISVIAAPVSASSPHPGMGFHTCNNPQNKAWPVSWLLHSGYTATGWREALPCRVSLSFQKVIFQFTSLLPPPRKYNAISSFLFCSHRAV